MAEVLAFPNKSPVVAKIYVEVLEDGQYRGNVEIVKDCDLDFLSWALEDFAELLDSLLEDEDESEEGL